MEIQVIYFSKNGSTKIIADAIASEFNVVAQDVQNAVLHDEGFVFLGSGCYGSKPSKKMIDFIKDNKFMSRNVALFGTSGGGVGKEVKMMEQLLAEQESCVKGSFYCKGKFFIMNRGRPNKNDTNEARAFATRMINE